MSVETPAFSLSEREMEQIERKFAEIRTLGRGREKALFGVFDGSLTAEETWALKFLYVHMPLNDLADYDGSLFLAHVRHALAVRKRAPWGERVPDQLFLHFVLPARVNTENIEDFREAIYAELGPRTTGLSMAEAILEANYWCHEKATYIGSDLRTLSPLGMIRNARGRCGEESTLAVAALRSIGIPARQCYTPRWAHCDDNHAWVEAWADGKWHYIGACEPEARLDQGWFSGPARRAMLVHTRVPATYPGPEEITVKGGPYAELNLLANYAPTRTIAVEVREPDGTPAAGARVQFQLYNYAELFPLAELMTDDRGEARFTTGYGDLIVRAVRDRAWGQRKIRIADGDRFEVALSGGLPDQPEGSEDFEMVPPPELDGPESEPLSAERVRRHEERVAEGAALRRGYEETFLTEAEADQLAAQLGLPAERVWKVLEPARGNSREIAAFLEKRVPEHGEWPLLLLESLREKDLTDTMRETLDDHLAGALPWKDSYARELFVPYVMCPRVLFEMIGPYRKGLQARFTEAEVAFYQADPSRIARLLNEGWELREGPGNLRGKAGPLGTFQLRAADKGSLDILFVALCRSFGIPARLHPSEQKPQYYTGGTWVDAEIGPVREEGAKTVAEARPPIGKLRLRREADGRTDAPAASYMENFTIARLEGGFYKTLQYPHGKTDVYDAAFEVEPGGYRITSGVRLKDGTVLGRLTYCVVAEQAETEVTLTFPAPSQHIPVYGIPDSQTPLWRADGTATTLGALCQGAQGAMIAWLEPDREPSKHLLRETGELAETFDVLGIPVVFVLGSEEGAPAPAVPEAAVAGLPEGAVFAGDPGHSALRRLTDAGIPLGSGGFPHLYALDREGNIRYVQSGYKPGSGKEALQVLSDL
ncbi:transglutaminase-like domain-containing protein [Paenibacillus timonensis]|uniref:Transglutaminase-like domain-containing protein n=1 Tax=Paenibacillus timonensis TaxID=225915 RepID=A0ABW3SG73_9BACL|nr:transglutaminase-like domain-containing protein [Paenibacillus timonensis]MCH1642389.1 transglutaminase-like domain-containing protein [Paenibacillus timonensis]